MYSIWRCLYLLIPAKTNSENSKFKVFLFLQIILSLSITFHNGWGKTPPSPGSGWAVVVALRESNWLILFSHLLVIYTACYKSFSVKCNYLMLELMLLFFDKFESFLLAFTLFLLIFNQNRAKSKLCPTMCLVPWVYVASSVYSSVASMFNV